MKIVITGFSGSGKSTLAKRLGNHYNIPVLHMDSLHYKQNWEERDKDEFESLTQEFINGNDSWIIDGNYRNTAKNRIDMADTLIFLDYNRFTCLKGVLSRYNRYKGKCRPDIAEGCQEKIDKDFFIWVIYEGRKKERRQRLLNQAKNHKNGLIFKNRKQLFKYLNENNINIE